MKPGDIIENLEVIDIADEGKAVCKNDGIVIFIDKEVFIRSFNLQRKEQLLFVIILVPAVVVSGSIFLTTCSFDLSKSKWKML
jgi:hypothetical protein